MKLVDLVGQVCYCGDVEYRIAKVHWKGLPEDTIMAAQLTLVKVNHDARVDHDAPTRPAIQVLKPSAGSGEYSFIVDEERPPTEERIAGFKEGPKSR